MDNQLIRYSSTHKTAISTTQDSSGIISGFSTIGTHPYFVIYNPGTLHYVDSPTTGNFNYNSEYIQIQLTMTEPQMTLVMSKLDSKSDFLKSDFVSLNFIGQDNQVIQVIAKPNGKKQLINIDEESVKLEIDTADQSWTFNIQIKWQALGLTAESFKYSPLPFDVVRFQRATGVVSSWATLPDQLPFNDPYEFPVFHFGLLSTKPVVWQQLPQQASSLGRLEYQGPAKITAGSFTNLTFNYQVGHEDLAPGGALLFNIRNEVIECNRRCTIIRHMPEKDWSPLQWDNPKQEGFVSISCSRKNVTFKLEQERLFSVTARHTGNIPLVQGDIVQITIGNGIGGPGIRSQLLAQNNYPFKFHIDLLGNNIYHPLPFPTVDIEGHTATRFVIHAPATPTPNEPFTLKIVAIDSCGNIATNYTGTCSIHAPNQLIGVPETYSFDVADKGVKYLEISVEPCDAFVINVMDINDTSINGASELIVTDGSFGPGKIVFGDTHTHTQLSDGRLHPFDKFREIADHRGLDFWAITDHDYDLTQERFELLKETMERFNIQDRFVTIPAYEWSPNMGQEARWDNSPTPGHRNVFFKTMPKRIYDGVRSESNTPSKLKAVLEQEEPENHLIISHFHCGDPVVIPEVDDGVEISGWCNSFHREERGIKNDIGGKYSVQDAYSLRSGFGVTAGTDHGTEAYYTGLPAEMTALYCNKLDRDHVFEALRSGTTYASTGQKVLLKFSVNGTCPHVGSSPISTSGERAIAIVIGSAKPVSHVSLIRNSKLLKNFPGFDFGVKKYDFTDSHNLDSGYYYVRVHTAQGHLTWSSPVWFESP